MHFKKAIVRTPGRSLVKGIKGAGTATPDYKKAMVQHKAYIKALEQCGLEVTILDASENFPDSVFVEDVSLCTSDGAIICNPGAESRKGEEELIVKAIESHLPLVGRIIYPGTVEAGDIMMVGNHFYIGLSDRTNRDGAYQIIAILSSFGYTASTVNLGNILHLKTAVSYIENKNLLCWQTLADLPEFDQYNKIIVPDNELYAANSLWINGTVLVPSGNPKTESLIQKHGYNTIALEMSEFRKLYGGLSCLSLRF